MWCFYCISKFLKMYSNQADVWGGSTVVRTITTFVVYRLLRILLQLFRTWFCVLQFQVADSRARKALQTCFKEPGAHHPSLLLLHVLNGTGTKETSLPYVSENGWGIGWFQVFENTCCQKGATLKVIITVDLLKASLGYICVH